MATLSVETGHRETAARRVDFVEIRMRIVVKDANRVIALRIHHEPRQAQENLYLGQQHQRCLQGIKRRRLLRLMDHAALDTEVQSAETGHREVAVLLTAFAATLHLTAE